LLLDSANLFGTDRGRNMDKPYLQSGAEPSTSSQTSAPFTLIDTPSPIQLSIAIIGPDDALRCALIDAVTKCRPCRVSDFSSYPPTLHDIRNLLAQKCDVVMIEIDSDPEYALTIIRAVCSSGTSTVMVYSRMPDTDVPDSDLLTRCTRIGAREFLSPPFSNRDLHDALDRAESRHLGQSQPKDLRGRFYLFCAAKGGAGVTNIACNFAMTMADLTAERTLLIDLDLPLGEAGLNLGVDSQYSTIDALQNYARMDPSFLRRLIVRHSSGLFVLPAPGQFPSGPMTNEAFDRLLQVARQVFENVIVDAGSKLDLANSCSEYLDATTVYMITQSGIPELRNANRLISQFRSMAGPKLEVVLNRYPGSGPRISEEQITRALTCPITWTIPNDYNAARAMQDTSVPVATSGSLISPQIDAMVRAARALPLPAPEKKLFSFRRWFLSSSERANRSGRSSSQPYDPVIPSAEDSSISKTESPSQSAAAFSSEPGGFTTAVSRRESSWNC
jgi:pilus assembly protein CpaE